MKRNCNKNNSRIGLIFIALGTGIVAVCIFPTEWIVVITAVTLVIAGLMLMKH